MDISVAILCPFSSSVLFPVLCHHSSSSYFSIFLFPSGSVGFWRSEALHNAGKKRVTLFLPVGAFSFRESVHKEKENPDPESLYSLSQISKKGQKGSNSCLS